MISYEEMIRIVAKEFFANSPDGRSREEIYSKMLDNFKRGWINKKFVEGAYDAIEKGSYVCFSFDPEKETHIWLAGRDKSSMETTLKAIEKNGLTMADYDKGPA